MHSFLAPVSTHLSSRAELAFVKGEGVGVDPQHLKPGLMMPSPASCNIPAFFCCFSKCAREAFTSLEGCGSSLKPHSEPWVLPGYWRLVLLQLQ